MAEIRANNANMGMVVYQEHNFTSVEDIIGFASTFPLEERYKVQATLLEEITKLHIKFGDSIEAMYNYVVADRAYQEKVSEADFKESWLQVEEIVQANMQQRNKAQEAVKYITQKWTSTLGHGWVQKISTEETATFLAAVRKLAQVVTFEDAAPRINAAILTRLQTTGRGVKTARRPLTGDINNARTIGLASAICSPDLLRKLGICIREHRLVKEGIGNINFPSRARKISSGKWHYLKAQDSLPLLTASISLETPEDSLAETTDSNYSGFQAINKAMQGAKEAESRTVT